MTSRPTAQRCRQARARLETEANVWLATASSEGIPHLVPLSLAWIDGQIVVATPVDTPTVDNVVANGRARASLDSADDVVIIDADVVVHPYDDVEAALTGRYVDRVGWDPKTNPGTWCLLVLTPRRGQAWNGPGEIAGRTIIRDGRWLDG